MMPISSPSEGQSYRRVAIVGAGIAGTTAALYLSKQGVSVDLFEREKAIFSKSSAIPAHLYSGVQYFGQLSKESIQSCMTDAIIFAKNFFFCLNSRPTVVAIAKKDSRSPSDLEEACRMNQKVYETECSKDIRNQVFGSPAEFYRTYSLEALLRIRKNPKSEEDEWIAAFADQTNLDELQFPICLVKEFGLDMRKAAGFFEQLISEDNNIKLHLNAEVKRVELIGQRVLVHALTNQGSLMNTFNLVIDASGSGLGFLEAQLGITKMRAVDIKMAGLFEYTFNCRALPEIYILGGKDQPAGESFMSHISPIREPGDKEKGLMIVNVTTTDCTYISDGKRSNEGKGQIRIDSKESPIAFDVFQNPESRRLRLLNMIERLKERHSALACRMIPVCGFPGMLNILGNNFLSRDSGIDAYPEKRFISINLAKGGAALRASEELYQEIEKSVYGLQLEGKKNEIIFIPKDGDAALRRVKDKYTKIMQFREYV